jgi:UDP-glucuronate 4-epimerase
MKVLVTGAAGFIGSRLAKVLIARGDEVVGLDNLNTYYTRERKEHNLADLQDQNGFEFVELDLRETAAILELFQTRQFDAVAHLAAMAAVRYSVQHPLIYGEVNVQGTLNLLDAGRQTSQPRYVLASTGSVYGRDTPVPFVEDAAAAMPLAPYPASKRAMEVFAHSFHHAYNLPISVARFFNVYGPHGRPDMMPWQWTMQIRRGEPLTLFNNGHMKRDWTYIDDIVRGLVAVLDAGFDWEILNFGCGNPVENRRFVEVLENLLGQRAQINAVPAPVSEPLETFADISKAKQLLNWTPQVQVEEGLKYFVEWLRGENLLPQVP